MTDDCEYHGRRSLEELQRGLSTSCTAAARAHLLLSSLHLSRARLLDCATVPRPTAGGGLSEPDGPLVDVA